MEPDASGGGDRLWIIGPGRLGLALGLALVQEGALSSLTVSGRRPNAPDHPLFDGSSPQAAYLAGLTPPPDANLVLIAVPDAQISAVAATIASLGGPSRTGLHTSGALGAEVFDALSSIGWATGSLHPLVAVSDAVRGAELLRGAWFGLEGDEAACAAGERLVRTLGGRTLRIRAGGKALYHASAVFASNYLVTLLATAERLAVDAGMTAETARAALADLARSALDGVTTRGPADALTGPIRRGDDETVALHLSRLSPPDAALYSVLARATVELARTAGLDHHAIARIGHLLPETD